MEVLTYEQKRIINPEYEETIMFLMEKIKKLMDYYWEIFYQRFQQMK